jgi:hypothetical protein
MLPVQFCTTLTDVALVHVHEIVHYQVQPIFSDRWVHIRATTHPTTEPASKQWASLQLQDGSTPLYMAAQNGCSELVSLLLKAGADARFPMCEDSEPWDPGCMAAEVR